MRILALVLVLVSAGCAPKAAGPTPPAYDASLLELAAAFAAKEACSCVFVTGRSEEDCRAWTRVSPAVARFQVDIEAREVRATALGMQRTVARYVDAQTGCVFVGE